VFQHPGTTKINVKIRVDGVRLNQLSLFKYLCFMMVANLLFAPHIARAAEKARSAAQVTAQLISRLSINDLKSIGIYFQCYVESQMYCLEILPMSALTTLKSCLFFVLRFPALQQ
jgi:hypothetical protein